MSKKSTYDTLILGVLGFGLGIGISLVEHQPMCDVCTPKGTATEVTASLLNYSPAYSYFAVRSEERKKATEIVVVSLREAAPEEEESDIGIRTSGIEDKKVDAPQLQPELIQEQESIELQIPNPETIPVEPEVIQSPVQEKSEVRSPKSVPDRIETTTEPTPVNNDFPSFGKAIYPVSKVPNWGAMRTPAEWNRKYTEMSAEDFVAVPPYDLSELTIPLLDLVKRKDDPSVIEILTAKLFYSTRFFGKYDLDSGEFAGAHAGVDLKLALGTPLGAVAGGRVNRVSEKDTLGKFVVIEHRIGEETFYSVYGHLGSTGVSEGQQVAPGQVIGYVGMTGNTAAPHLHLQVDRGTAGEARHEPYAPSSVPSTSEASRFSINPISFISRY